MSVLVVGVSHRTAPVEVLEQLALDANGQEKLLRAVTGAEYVREVTVLATCNRVEIYADVERFHGSVEVLGRLLCELSPVDSEGIVPYLYVHYDDAAVSHLFQVVSGLDSMAVGEGQILGQVREALRLGQDAAGVGATLNALFQQALRVGKRVHAETDIDRAAPSLVRFALDQVIAEIGPLAGKRAMVVGAGGMAGLAVSTLRAEQLGEIVVANRSASSALRLASEYSGRAVDLDAVAEELAGVDVLISCTGASGIVLDAGDVAQARAGLDSPLALVDLALPHDIDPAVADLERVSLIALATLAQAVQEGPSADDVLAVRQIVSDEVSAFLAARRAAGVTPTVVALRAMATGVVDDELERLAQRLPDLDPAVRAEVESAVRRVAGKLIHSPTVRVRELADNDAAVSYADVGRVVRAGP